MPSTVCIVSLYVCTVFAGWWEMLNGTSCFSVKNQKQDTLHKLFFIPEWSHNPYVVQNNVKKPNGAEIGKSRIRDDCLSTQGLNGNIPFSRGIMWEFRRGLIRTGWEQKLIMCPPFACGIGIRGKASAQSEKRNNKRGIGFWKTTISEEKC